MGSGSGRPHPPETGPSAFRVRRGRDPAGLSGTGPANPCRLEGPVRGPSEPSESRRMVGEEQAHRYRVSGQPAVARRRPRERCRPSPASPRFRRPRSPASLDDPSASTSLLFDPEVLGPRTAARPRISEAPGFLTGPQHMCRRDKNGEPGGRHARSVRCATIKVGRLGSGPGSEVDTQESDRSLPPCRGRSYGHP